MKSCCHTLGLWVDDGEYKFEFVLQRCLGIVQYYLVRAI